MTKKNTNEKETKKKEVKVKKAKKEKKSLMRKITGYFKGVKKEISRIRWTKKKDLLKYSIATVVFVVFFGVYFYVIDLLVALLRSSL